MVKLKIGDAEYGLLMDLEALEQIQTDYESIAYVADKLKKNDVKTIKGVFKIFANAALTAEGKDPTVTGNELNTLRIAALRGIGSALTGAINEGMKSETTSGDVADDEVYDVYLAEIEEKNV